MNVDESPIERRSYDMDVQTVIAVNWFKVRVLPNDIDYWVEASGPFDAVQIVAKYIGGTNKIYSADRYS